MKQDIYNEIETLIEELDVRDQLEIISNLLISIGCNGIDSIPPGTPIEGSLVVEAILEDRKQNGETLANAIALQGLTMLSWLNGEK